MTEVAPLAGHEVWVRVLKEEGRRDLFLLGVKMGTSKSNLTWDVDYCRCSGGGLTGGFASSSTFRGLCTGSVKSSLKKTKKR